VIARLEVLDAGADLGDDACALVATEHREANIGMPTCYKMVVGVAHARRFHLNLDLVLDRVAELDFLDRPRLVELPDESTFVFIEYVPSARASEARLEPLVRCVTSTPKQPLGREVTRWVAGPRRGGSNQAVSRLPRCARCGSACPDSGRPTR